MRAEVFLSKLKVCQMLYNQLILIKSPRGFLSKQMHKDLRGEIGLGSLMLGPISEKKKKMMMYSTEKPSFKQKFITISAEIDTFLLVNTL